MSPVALTGNVAAPAGAAFKPCTAASAAATAATANAVRRRRRRATVRRPCVFRGEVGAGAAGRLRTVSKSSIAGRWTARRSARRMRRWRPSTRRSSGFAAPVGLPAPRTRVAVVLARIDVIPTTQATAKAVAKAGKAERLRRRGTSGEREPAGDRRGREPLASSPTTEAAAEGHGARAPSHTTIAGRTIASEVAPTMRSCVSSLAKRAAARMPAPASKSSPTAAPAATLPLRTGVVEPVRWVEAPHLDSTPVRSIGIALPLLPTPHPAGTPSLTPVTNSSSPDEKSLIDHGGDSTSPKVST